MYLIDTMVVSEWSKSRPNPDVLTWFSSIRFEDAYLSVVTVGEIERGLHKFKALTGTENQKHRAWLEMTLVSYGKRVLPVTTAIMRRWGELSWEVGNVNPDLLIAATALEHDLTVATRNIRHFEPTGAKLFNPYEA